MRYRTNVAWLLRRGNLAAKQGVATSPQTVAGFRRELAERVPQTYQVQGQVGGSDP